MLRCYPLLLPQRMLQTCLLGLQTCLQTSLLQTNGKVNDWDTLGPWFHAINDYTTASAEWTYTDEEGCMYDIELEVRQVA